MEPFEVVTFSALGKKCVRLRGEAVATAVVKANRTASRATGCSGKNVFFHNSLQPLSTQCECTVTPIDWPFPERPIAAKAEVAKECFVTILK